MRSWPMTSQKHASGEHRTKAFTYCAYPDRLTQTVDHEKAKHFIHSFVFTNHFMLVWLLWIYSALYQGTLHKVGIRSASQDNIHTHLLLGAILSSQTTCMFFGRWEEMGELLTKLTWTWGEHTKLYTESSRSSEAATLPHYFGMTNMGL